MQAQDWGRRVETWCRDARQKIKSVTTVVIPSRDKGHVTHYGRETSHSSYLERWKTRPRLGGVANEATPVQTTSRDRGRPSGTQNKNLITDCKATTRPRRPRVTQHTHSQKYVHKDSHGTLHHKQSIECKCSEMGTVTRGECTSAMQQDVFTILKSLSPSFCENIHHWKD